MSWLVEFTFLETRVPIPNKNDQLPSLPHKDDILRMTPAYIEMSDDDEPARSSAWRVKQVDLMFSEFKSYAYITLVPWRENDLSTTDT